MPTDLSYEEAEDAIYEPRAPLGRRIGRAVSNVVHPGVRGKEGRIRRLALKRVTKEVGLTENGLLQLVWDRTITNVSELPAWANRARAARAMWKKLLPTAKKFGDSTTIAVASAKWAEGNVDLSGQFLDALEEVIAEEEGEEDGTSGPLFMDSFLPLIEHGETAQEEAELDVPPLTNVPENREVSDVEAKSWAQQGWDAMKAKVVHADEQATAAKALAAEKVIRVQEAAERRVRETAETAQAFVQERMDDVEAAKQELLDTRDKVIDTGKMIGFGMAAIAAAFLLTSIAKKK